MKRLLQDNHKVFGVDNPNNYYSKALKEDRNSLLNHKNYFFHLDLNELGKIKGNFDLAINLAAQAGIRLGKKDKHLYIDSNIKGF